MLRVGLLFFNVKKYIGITNIFILEKKTCEN
jgi:hypothetical protein